MHYEGPIYRPPSEADSLLIQATVGCPHNRCTFCLVYKDGPNFRIRSVEDIIQEMQKAADDYGKQVKTLFFPAGNTIAMKTEHLCDICEFAGRVFTNLQRITVYGSSQYIYKKGANGLKQLAAAGLSRIHVGLESGDNEILDRIKKGTNSPQQVKAGEMVMNSGIELSMYVILGIGGKERSETHIAETVKVLNKILPNFIRLRTFVPKKDTPLLQNVLDGTFEMLGPHAILNETAALIRGLDVNSYLTSDHYTNYINVEGRLPDAKSIMLEKVNNALRKNESQFRPFFIGQQ